MVSKLLKLLGLTFPVFLSLLVITVTPASAGDKILEFTDPVYTFQLEYSPSKKEVKLKYKKPGRLRRFTTYGPLDISTPSKVDLSLNMLASFFERHTVPEDSRETIRNRIHEFKFISPQECQALHFSLEADVLSTQAISGLMAEVEKIRMAQNPGGDAYRSVLVREFETEEDGKIQLRMVLDKDGEFLKFSFARDSKDLTHYSWNQDQGLIHLKNPSGKTILQVDFNNFKKDGGLLIVKHPVERGVEQASRSYFRFTRSPASQKDSQPWAIRPYTTKHFSETVIRDGVALTSTMADHTAVIQLHNSEVAFPRFPTKSIKEDSLFLNLPDESLTKIEGFYNRCMGERLSFIFEEESLGINHSGDEDKEQQELCSRNARLEGISIFLQHELERLEVREEKMSDLIPTLRSCLVEQKIGRIEEGIFNFDYSYISQLTDEDMDSVFNDCSHATRKKLVYDIAKERVESGEAKGRLDNNRALELLWTTVSSTLKDHCLDVVPSSEINSCLDYAQISADQNLFLAEVSSHLSQLYAGNVTKYGQHRLSLVADYDECRGEYHDQVISSLREGSFKGEILEQIKEKELRCSRTIAKELALINADAFFEDALKRTGIEFSDSVKANVDLMSQSKESFGQCLEEQMADEGSVDQLVSRLSFHQESCLTRSIESFAKAELLSYYDKLFDRYDFLHNEEQRASIRRGIERKISNKLENWSEVGGLEKVLEDLMPVFYGSILENHIGAIEDNVLGEDQINLKAQLERAVEGLMSDSSSRPMSLKAKKYFEDIMKVAERGDKSKEDYLNVALNEILGEIHKSTGPLATEKDLKQFVLLDSDRSEMKGRVDVVFKECIDTFSPNGGVTLERKYLECEKKRLAKVSFELTRRKLQQSVSNVFPLTSRKANQALAPLQYLELCYENIDRFGSKSIDEYKKLVAGCERVAELDVSYNVSVAKVEGYRPLLSRKGYHDAVTAYCYNIIFHHMGEGDAESKIPRRGSYEGTYRDLTSLQQADRQRNPTGGSLLKYFSRSEIRDPEFAESDQRQLLGLVETFAANDPFNEEWWGDKLAHCEKGSNDYIMVSFRQFVIESIPALNWTDANSPNEKVMRDFLDFELVSSLLEYKTAFERQHGSQTVDLGHTVPGERHLNPEMGVTALTNFIQILGGYISRGFVYDEAAMRTELIVFQSELKAFLKWSATNPDKISIREAREFFQESKLAEHLGMAVISESVHQKFGSAIREMEQKEKDDFLKAENCRYVSCLDRKEKERYNAITAKYDNLRSLSFRMTSSYDFRRIIRPETEEGKEILDAIKDTYLMPKILGEPVTPQAEERIMELVGAAILRDNTDGGFADMFAHEAAQFALDKERGERWGITKWLFFDSKDFDWDTLKHTESGRKAASYYARYIMLPRFLGKEISNYQRDVRLQRFRRLLTDAQGENSK